MATSFSKDLEKAKVFEIYMPKDYAWSLEKAQALIDHLLVIHSGRLLFRIVATSKRTVWQIIDCRTLSNDAAFTVNAINAFCPEAEVRDFDYEHPEFEKPFIRDTIPFYLEKEFYFPIRPITEFKDTDPVSAIVNTMSELREGERVILTIYVGGYIDEKRHKWAQKRIKKDSSGQFAVQAGFFVVDMIISGVAGKTASSPDFSSAPGTGRYQDGKYVPDEQVLYERKLYDSNLYDCFIIYQKDYPGQEPPENLGVNELMLLLATTAGINGFMPYLDKDRERGALWLVDSSEKEQRTSALGMIGGWADGKDDSWKKMRSVLSTDEFLSLWHLPHKDFAAPNISWITGQQASKEMIANQNGAVIGVNKGIYPIRIHPEDRKHHMYIVGRTGMGKSTLLHNLVHQDIADGHGVAVLDPHGKLIDDILSSSIPPEREEDVVILDISNFENPPPLNPLISAYGDASTQITSILNTIEDGLPKRISDTTEACFATLSHAENPTVLDIFRLFHDIDFRNSLIRRTRSRTTHEFWHVYNNASPSFQRELHEPVIRRMKLFYNNKYLERMFCHPDPIDLAKHIDEGRILLVSLHADERKIPQKEQQLIGIVFVTLLRMAAVSRGTEFDNRYYLYIDEVQNFIKAPLDEVLTQARKFGLHLVMANQYVGQVRGRLLDSVMGNIGSTILFRIGENDAPSMARFYSPEFSAQDLASLDKYTCAVRTQLEGVTMRPFSVTTYPPPETDSATAQAREEKLRTLSVENYTPRTRGEIDEWLDDRYPPLGIPPQPSDDRDPTSWTDTID